MSLSLNFTWIIRMVWLPPHILNDWAFGHAALPAGTDQSQNSDSVGGKCQNCIVIGFVQ